jgi:hypothetical protein
MSPVFAARRRAEEFAAAIEDPSARPTDAARYDELLDLVGALRASAPVEPRPAFSADLRERLMAAAATELVPAGATPAIEDRLTLPRRTPRERRLAVAVGAFALVGATTSMAVAAQSALPGDALYPLKRAIENAHTGISVDDEGKGSTLLANASGRLEEVDRLARVRDEEEVDVRAIEDTLDTFTQQATEASDLMLGVYADDGDPTAIAELQTFTQDSFASLNQLAAATTDEVRDALIPVGNTLVAIDAAIQAACPTCADTLTSLPTWLIATTAQTVDDTLGGLLTTVQGAVTPPGQNGGKDTGQGKGSGQGRGDGGSGQDGGETPVTLPTAPVPTTPVLPPTGTGPNGGGSTGGSGGGSTGGGGPKNPVDDLLTGLLGGGSGGGTTTPTQQPSLPVVGPVLEGVGEVVGGLLGSLNPSSTPKP